MPSLRTRVRSELAEVASLPVRIRRILARTALAFVEDNVSRLGAALAFYTTVAVAPLMVVALALAGFFFGDQGARDSVMTEIEQMVGGPAAEALGNLESPFARPEGIVATVVGTLTLIFGAYGVFHHLQGALNSIWRTKPPSTLGFWVMVRRRLFSASVVLVTGFLLLVSLILSATLSWLGANAIGHYQLPTRVLEATNTAVSLLMVTTMFALLFKLLPDRQVLWRHVWLGAGVTAVLFTVGKTVLGLYLAHVNTLSAYGAASSLITLLLWCYYAAQIVFLGAEFTRVTSLSKGGRDFTPLDAPEQHIRQSHYEQQVPVHPHR